MLELIGFVDGIQTFRINGGRTASFCRNQELLRQFFWALSGGQSADRSASQTATMFGHPRP